MVLCVGCRQPRDRGKKTGSLCALSKRTVDGLGLDCLVWLDVGFGRGNDTLCVSKIECAGLNKLAVAGRGCRPGLLMVVWGGV